MGEIKIEIAGRIPSKKNSKQVVKAGNRMLFIPSKKYKEWHEEASYMLCKHRPKKPIEKIKTISIQFYFPDLRKCDLTNKAESIMDLLVDNRILLDDNWDVCPEVTLISKGLDRENPGAKIIINY